MRSRLVHRRVEGGLVVLAHHNIHQSLILGQQVGNLIAVFAVPGVRGQRGVRDTRLNNLGFVFDGSTVVLWPRSGSMRSPWHVGTRSCALIWMSGSVVCCWGPRPPSWAAVVSRWWRRRPGPVLGGDGGGVPAGRGSVVGVMRTYCHGPDVSKRGDVTAWVAELRRMGRAEATIARKLAARASLYAWARRNGVTDADPLAGVRRPRAHSDDVDRFGLDRDQARTVLTTAAAYSSMAHALTALLLLTGVRVSEAINADLEDVSAT